MTNFPAKKLLEWYRDNKRILPWRNTGTPPDIYKIWVSEVMLQQTQVSTVIPYYNRFLEAFPTVEELAKAPEEKVLKLWEGLGYYNRVRNIHKAAAKVVTQFQGIIPGTPDVFKTLPGVGPYILAAVMSIARNHPLAAVDGNVIRVFCRFRGLKENVRKGSVKKQITGELNRIIPHEVPGDFNQAMMELGALICTPKKPVCNQCPLQEGCKALAMGTTGEIPYKSPSRTVPRYQVAIAVIARGKTFYIQKRPSRGHLGGMWEFPGGKGEAAETPEQTLVRECVEELKVQVVIESKLARVAHIYSHFHIDLHVFICRLEDESHLPSPSLPHNWITIDQLAEYPFPGANHKFFPALKEYFMK